MPVKSLRIRLLALLGALILLASAAQFATLFQVSLSSANTLFDYHMRQMALALQDSSFEQIPLDGAGKGQGFDFVIQVWSDAGNQVYQSRQHRALPHPDASDGYANVTLFNGEWRIYTVHTQHKVIQVAQQMQARRKRTIQIALQSLWPVWLGALLLLAASWWVVTSALKPVERVRHELGQRDGNSLEPLDAGDLPQEITPLVNDMNALLLRVSDTLSAQQRFIADAAHELRSPLTALKLQVQLLPRARDQQERQLAESRLAAATERVIHLAEQLLLLAREEAQDADSRHAILDLHAYVRQAIDDVAPFSGSKQIAIQLDLSGEALIHAPRNAIHIVLRNLLDNAIRYTPAGGQIQIATRADSQGVRLSIADSGPGIDDAERERVFDRFYRISGNQQSGSGLGLAIVKTITDRLGARIQLSRAHIGGLQVDIAFI